MLIFIQVGSIFNHLPLPMPKKFLQIHPQDNVLVALTDLPKGETIVMGALSLSLTTDIKAKHKFPIHALAKGDAVIMYGVLIGFRKGFGFPKYNLKSNFIRLKPFFHKFFLILRLLLLWPDHKKIENAYNSYHENHGAPAAALSL